MSQHSERVAFAAIWHQLPFEELAALVHHADALGYEAAYLDGDVTTVPSLGERDVLDGWTVQVALTLATRQIQIAAIHLVHHWNAARLAQSIATLERIAPGRQRTLVSVGGQEGDRSAGLRFPAHAERVLWLDEMLEAMKRLWSEPEVSCSGTFVQLEAARVRPRPDPAPVIEIGASATPTLGVVARRADAWNVNLPVVPYAVDAAADRLARECESVGRDPAGIERSQWLFARPERAGDDARTLAEYRRFAPWFSRFSDEELRLGFLSGGPETARERLTRFSQELALDLPVIDVTGLELAEARTVLEIFAPRHGGRASAS